MAAYRRTAFRILSALCVLNSVDAHDVAAQPMDPTVRNGPDVAGGYASDSIIIKLAPGVLASPFNRKPPMGKAVQNRWVNTPPAAMNRAFHKACGRWGVQCMERVIKYNLRDPQAAAALGLDRYFVLQVPPGTDTRAMVASFAALGGEIEQVGLNRIGRVAGVIPGQTQLIPNDPKFCDQYNMHNTTVNCLGGVFGTADADIDAPEAWALHTGDPGTVTIGIIDSGVTPHPDFAERLLPGYNAVNPLNQDTTDALCPHGTHVAGIAAASGNNDFGVAGVTWGANILPVRVFDGCSGFEDDVADGIIWAVNNGADILNMSIEFCERGVVGMLPAAIQFANSQGVLMVAAAGNTNGCGLGVVAAPASYPEVMAVSGTNRDDEITTLTNSAGIRWSSNFGPEIEVAAPGDWVLSTWIGTPSPPFFRLSGTSMASPHVAGLAALIKSFVPSLSAAEIRQVIQETADDLTWNPNPAGSPLVGRDDYYGFGRINAFEALRRAGPQRILAGIPPDGAIDARQPFEPDGSDPTGWDTIQLFFGGSGVVSTIAPADLVLSEAGDVASPSIATLIPDDAAGTLTVVLDQPITVGARTTITHTPSGTSITLGFLPGDVNGNGTAGADDVALLIGAVAGTVESLPMRSVDIDRSTRVDPLDVLRLIDLLNGADQYPSFLGATLP